MIFTILTTLYTKWIHSSQFHLQIFVEKHDGNCWCNCRNMYAASVNGVKTDIKLATTFFLVCIRRYVVSIDCKWSNFTGPFHITKDWLILSIDGVKMYLARFYIFFSFAYFICSIFNCFKLEYFKKEVEVGKIGNLPIFYLQINEIILFFSWFKSRTAIVKRARERFFLQKILLFSCNLKKKINTFSSYFIQKKLYSNSFGFHLNEKAFCINCGKLFTSKYGGKTSNHCHLFGAS